MAKPKAAITWLWLSYPSRFKKTETIHNSGCEFYGKSHGRGISDDEVTSAMVNCRICKGARSG